MIVRNLYNIFLLAPLFGNWKLLSEQFDYTWIRKNFLGGGKEMEERSVKLVTCFREGFSPHRSTDNSYIHENIWGTTQRGKVNWIWLHLKQDYTLLYSETKVGGIGSIMNNMRRGIVFLKGEMDRFFEKDWKRNEIKRNKIMSK